MTDKELMHQALEALEFYYDQHGEESDARVITALRERLAQPEQEPVAVVKALPMGHNQTDMHYAECQHLPVGTLLYTSPPAQRTWVGLTRAERFEIEKAMSKYYDYQHECKTVCLPEFARAIEAKLLEKNA